MRAAAITHYPRYLSPCGVLSQALSTPNCYRTGERWLFERARGAALERRRVSKSHTKTNRKFMALLS